MRYLPRLNNLAITAVAVLAALLLNAGFSVWEAQSTKDAIDAQQAANRAAAYRIEAELCGTFKSLYADQPPAGNPATNPSRKYLDELHARLGEVPPDLRCNSGGTHGRAG